MCLQDDGVPEAPDEAPMPELEDNDADAQVPSRPEIAFALKQLRDFTGSEETDETLEAVFGAHRYKMEEAMEVSSQGAMHNK